MQARLGIRVATAVVLALLPLSAAGEGPAQASIVSSAPRSAAAAVAAAPRVAAAPKIAAVPVRSGYENATRVVSRDIGFSVALPDGHDLWLFGDTGIYNRSGNAWQRTTFIDGSTAMISGRTRGQVPRGTEVPASGPARFVPVPKGVYMPDGSGQLCERPTPSAAFSARWPTGAAMMPGYPAEVLVTYGVVCVTYPSKAGAASRSEGWGYLLYNWKTRHIDHGPIDVFKPQKNGAALPISKQFGWPVVDKGTVTMFSAACTKFYVSCTSGHVWSVTVPGTVKALDNPASYKVRAVSTDGSAPWRPLTISVGSYGDGLRLVEQTAISGTYRIFKAPSATARWHLVGSGTLPDCKHTSGFCFGLEGHPELSTPSRVFVSYKDPGSGPGGHVVVSALPG